MTIGDYLLMTIGDYLLMTIDDYLLMTICRAPKFLVDPLEGLDIW
jgi:hypothetical protein